MVTMSRAEILEQLPSRPSEHAKAAALRALWQPSVRDLEIVRLHTEEGLPFNQIAQRVGVSPQRVSYLYRRYHIRLEERVQEEQDERR